MQNYLKDQMVFVQRQKEAALQKRSMDALEVKRKTKDFLAQSKLTSQVRREVCANTQDHNKKEFVQRLDEARQAIDQER